MPVIVVLLCLFGVLLFVQMGALVELFQQVKQIRIHLDMVDRPIPLDLGEAKGAFPSEIGLPVELDAASNAVVLFLSNRCGSCHTIASYFEGGTLPKRLWLVVVPVTGDGQEFVESYRLYGDRIIVDRGQEVVGRLGMDVSPAALLIENGRIEGGQTVPTMRQLYELIPASETKYRLTPRLSARPEQAETTHPAGGNRDRRS
jgi:hypothetical protein